MYLEPRVSTQQFAKFWLASSLLVIAACGQSGIDPNPKIDTPPTPTAVPLPITILPDGFEVEFELATSPEETTTGLMFRPSLPANRGMLLLWQQERRATIWMMNVLVPLDIIFLDNAGEVVALVENARPCSAEPCPRFSPDVQARAVLEIAAGGVAAHDIEVGSKLRFERVPGYPMPNEE